MNKVFCWLTGGHRYDDSRSMATYDYTLDRISVKNRCVKCGNVTVLKAECADCKYCVKGGCTHPCKDYCKHCELWTPNWYAKGRCRQ